MSATKDLLTVMEIYTETLSVMNTKAQKITANAGNISRSAAINFAAEVQNLTFSLIENNQRLIKQMEEDYAKSEEGPQLSGSGNDQVGDSASGKTDGGRG